MLVTSHCRSGCKLCFFIMEKDLLPARASVLQHQSTALRAACPRTAAGCAAGAAAGCPGLSCRAGPCCAPGAVCRGRDSAACQAQHSALSTQPAWGAAQGTVGRRVGGWSPPAGQGRAGQGRGLLLPQLLPGAGGSQLHCIPESCQGHLARGETSQGFSHTCP